MYDACVSIYIHYYIYTDEQSRQCFVTSHDNEGKTYPRSKRYAY
jgi:hypothetical protein